MVKRRKLKRVEKNVKKEQDAEVTEKVNGYGEESQVHTDFLGSHFFRFFRETQSSKNFLNREEFLKCFL